MKNNCIAENCRSILGKLGYSRELCHHNRRVNPFSQQGCPSNPIRPPYGTENLQVSVECRETPFGLSSQRPVNNFNSHSRCMNRSASTMQPIFNRQTTGIQYLSSPSDHCIELMTNTILTKIRCKIPQKELALLCCCLPSLIRELMCKSPWLTANDIIQWLTADIIREAISCFDDNDLYGNKQFKKTKREDQKRGRLGDTRKAKRFSDTRSRKSNEEEDDDDDENDNLSSHQSIENESSQQESDSSERSSRSDLATTDKSRGKKKKNRNRTPSTRSFSSRQSDDHDSDVHRSTKSSPSNTRSKHKKSDKDGSSHMREDQRSTSSFKHDPSLSIDSVDSNEDSKETDRLTPKSKPDDPSTRVPIEYPGKKDPNALQDVEKCLAFYQKIRGYFDDDVAAMLLKCCLCYGDCSGRK